MQRFWISTRAHLSLIHPARLNGTILLRPVVQRENPGSGIARASTYRRDLWLSREQAAQKLKTKPF